VPLRLQQDGWSAVSWSQLLAWQRPLCQVGRWEGMEVEMSEEMSDWHEVMHGHVQRCWAQARGRGCAVSLCTCL
jgi:hypothetical protein